MPTSTVLYIPDSALLAAEHLQSALRALNIADGKYAWQRTTYPYGVTHDALRATLQHMIDGDGELDYVTEGSRTHSERSDAFADFVQDQCADNGENVEYQITQVLGWTLVLTSPPWETHGDESRIVLGNVSNYLSRAPKVLGGDR